MAGERVVGDGESCLKCGQFLPDAPGIGGEHKCPLCGVPMLHDDPLPAPDQDEPEAS